MVAIKLINSQGHIYFLMSFLLTLCISLNVLSQNSIVLKYGNTITTEDLNNHLSILASDEFEGRETATKGQKLAMQYLAKQFELIGLAPPVDGSYFQEYILEKINWDTVLMNIGGMEYVFLEDFYGSSQTNESDLIMGDSMVFVGYGIESESYNDYAGIDANGKVVVMITGEPMSKKGYSHVTREEGHSEWHKAYRKKLRLAKGMGATAVLMVDELLDTKVYYFSKRGGRGYLSFPDTSSTSTKYLNNFYISEDMIQAIFDSRGLNFKKIRSKINKKGRPNSFIMDIPTKIEVRRDIKNVTAENVLGYLEGNRDKGQLIIISAHYDHLGIRDDEIYNGADDDGSGTVALLELAQAFAEAKKEGNGPSKSILFLAFSGEEKGLLGSKYYTSNPVFPLDSTITNLNIDMIGRQDSDHLASDPYVYIIGSDKLSQDLHEINEAQNKTYSNLDLDYTYNDADDPNRFYYRSDHYNFAKNNIPVIFYFTGIHADYHKPTDTIDKIDFNQISEIAKLIFYTSWELANMDGRPALIEMPEEDGE